MYNPRCKHHFYKSFENTFLCFLMFIIVVFLLLLTIHIQNEYDAIFFGVSHFLFPISNTEWRNLIVTEF